MKRKFAIEIIFILTALLFTGCSNGEGKAGKLKEGDNLQQSSNTSKSVSNTTIKKDAKTITDSDLINSAGEDSSVQLDSLDDQLEQLSPDEIDSLLSDNSDLNNIPSNFSVN